MRDPYSVLGVSKTASDADIKKAFRNLAKKHHPDQNQDDPSAQERFSEVNQAYEVIGDKAQRAKFDRGQIDAKGKQKSQPHGFDGFSDFQNANTGGFRSQSTGGGSGGFDDILSDILGGFGGRGRARGPGAGPTGARSGPGTGPRPGGARGPSAQKGKNADLLAAASLEDIVNVGKAQVTLPSGKTVNVTIPAGTREGEKIRLRGQGYPGEYGGTPGDAMVEIRFKPHTLFDVRGDDLILEMPLTLYEAVLGAKVRTPTLTGAVNLSIPANSSGDTTMRLKGKGLPTKTGGHGDLLVKLQIALPPNADEELDTLMKAWQSVTPYRARGPEFD
ncbi:J domain-containing protein [Roseibium algae]|uniref:J domain-containing protein n=1 Tax=Roseibium algae TaxID=3123038 RepID=A0ABU8TH03_9HYPH